MAMQPEDKAVLDSLLAWYAQERKKQKARPAQFSNALSSLMAAHIHATCGSNDAAFEAAIAIMRTTWERVKAGT